MTELRACKLKSSLGVLTDFSFVRVNFRLRALMRVIDEIYAGIRSILTIVVR